MRNGQLLRLWLALVVPGAVLAVAAHVLPLSPLDLAATTELQEQRPGEALMTALMLAISVPGDYPWAELIVGVACIVPLLGREWRQSLLIVSTVTGDGMALLVKALVQRPRPGGDLVRVYEELQGYGFPSGHVVHYVVFFGSVSYLAYRALRSASAQPNVERLALRVILSLCWVFVLLIGLSRVYLGAHWLSDVLGGYLLGGAWLVGLLAAYRRWLEPGSTPAGPMNKRAYHAVVAVASGNSSATIACRETGRRTSSTGQ